MANEKRLIDANAALKKMQNWNTKERLINCVEDAPTVDAVEVVRCKDCKHRENGLCPMESVEQYPWFATKNDGFCSYGERRNDGKSTSA